jgi:D-glycero-D-manno-heptose 1,7-bisphosphate phosphatase
MLEQAARDWPIDRDRSFLIGDKDDDVATARAFHIHGVKFHAQTESLVDLVRKQLARRTG